MALCLLLSWSAQAGELAQAPDFYLGSSPIDGRDEAARNAAIRDAMSEVLVRMTGDVSISVNPAAQALMADARRYMRSYRYAEEPIVAQDDEPGSAQRSRQLLRVDFEASVLTRAARQQGLPLWDSRRPVTAVWLLGPTQEGPRQLYSAQLMQERLPGLIKGAQRRGLPLVVPGMDQADLDQVGSYEVISEDYEKLATASARYQARHILLSRIERRQDIWYALFSFIQPDAPPMRWQATSDNPNEALNRGFDRYADELAARYATRVASGWEQEAKLRVVGLYDLSAYARVLNFLEQHDLINQVFPSALMNDEMVFSLRFDGELSDLQRVLLVSGILQEEAAPASGVGLIGEAGGDSSDSALEQTSGLNFYAVSVSPELRYRYLP